MKKKKRKDYQLVIDFDETLLFSFLESGGVGGWNSFIHRMGFQGHLKHVRSPREFLLSMVINFSSYQSSFIDVSLSNLDLRQFCFSNCCFDNTELTMTEFGVVENCSFRDVTFSGSTLFSIGGSDFTGATFRAISWAEVCYRKSNPPVGLSDEILEQCYIIPEEAPVMSSDLCKTSPATFSGKCSVFGEFS